MLRKPEDTSSPHAAQESAHAAEGRSKAKQARRGAVLSWASWVRVGSCGKDPMRLVTEASRAIGERRRHGSVRVPGPPSSLDRGLFDRK